VELVKIAEEIIDRLGYPSFVSLALAWLCYRLITVNFKEVSTKLTRLTELTDILHLKVDGLEQRLQRVEDRR
jgi:hypothetical protein